MHPGAEWSDLPVECSRYFGRLGCPQSSADVRGVQQASHAVAEQLFAHFDPRPALLQSLVAAQGKAPTVLDVGLAGC
jgi:hypothetical protein